MLLFQGFPDGFRLPVCEVMEADRRAVELHIGGQDMEVWVSAIVVLVDQVRLVAEAQSLHIFLRDDHHFIPRKLFRRVEIQADVEAVHPDTRVDRRHFLQHVQPLERGNRMDITGIIFSMENLRHAFLHLVFIVMESLTEIPAGAKDRNHFSAVLLMNPCSSRMYFSSSAPTLSWFCTQALISLDVSEPWSFRTA